MRTVEIPEYGSIVEHLDPSLAAQVHAHGVLSVAPATGVDCYALKARQLVGVVRYEGLEVRIVPKVSVARLLYMASYAEDPNAWQQIEADLAEAADPLSALAEAVVLHFEKALSPSPLQGYVTHEQAEDQLRGRILFDRQIASRAGLLLPVEVRFDEYETSIVENRILKAALLTLERAPLSRRLRPRVAHLRRHLDGVRPWPVGQEVPDILFGRINLRYRSAIALARIVLEHRSLEFPEAAVSGSAFLFNMNTVFERFLTRRLASELERIDGHVAAQHQTHLDEDQAIELRPDITWWAGGRSRAVIDAKYKRTTSADFPNADAYQMLAYCTRLGLADGHLVYADLDGSQPAVRTIENAGVRIHVHEFDISGEPAETDAMTKRLAVALSATSQSAMQPSFAATGNTPSAGPHDPERAK